MSVCVCVREEISNLLCIKSVYAIQISYVKFSTLNYKENNNKKKKKSKTALKYTKPKTNPSKVAE